MMYRLPLIAALAVAASPVAASSTAAWTANDRAAELACLKETQFKDARVSPTPLRFSDTLGVDARLVTGTYAVGKTRTASRKPGMLICLYDRKSGKAEAMDAQGWLMKKP